MRVYLDGAYRCHARDGEGRITQEHAFFDGKCEAFINAYRFVPAGHTWMREDGAVFCGEMIAPYMDIAPAMAAQRVWDEATADAAACAEAYDKGVQSA